MKLLICGDSFAADWSVKYCVTGWPNLLAENNVVTNLAQAGCSEYRIKLQLDSVDLCKFDRVIIAHTSPYRLYVKQNPLHTQDPLHCTSDFIYSDVDEHGLDIVKQYYEQFYDLEYAKFVHGLICKDITEYVGEKALHVSLFDYSDLWQPDNMISFAELFARERGTINHLTDQANRKVYEKIIAELEKSS